MRHEFREHGALSVHVDLAGGRSHVDASDRGNVPVPNSWLPELLGGHNDRHFDLHQLRNILDKVVLRR